MTPAILNTLVTPNKLKHTKISARVGQTKVHLGLDRHPSTNALVSISIDVHQEGTFSRSALYVICHLFSIALKHGAPLQRLIDTLRLVDMGPHDVTECDVAGLTECRGVLDFVGRALEQEAQLPRIEGAK